MGKGVTGNFLNAAAVNAALVGTRFGRRLQHFTCVGSTNAMLLESAANGAPEGTVYVADEQTVGRGRGGHTWHSVPGDGLYVSALTTPSLALSNALQISLATGLAAQGAIKNVTGMHVDLRWPNDLLLNGKKCGGILVETAVQTDAASSLRHAVIGVGINVNHANFPDDLRSLATSLRIESGATQGRSTVLVAFLRALDRELSLLEYQDASHRENFLERFGAASSWVRGKRVSVPEQGGYTGITAGLDRAGFLLVQCDDGATRTVLSGGVREL